MIDSNPQFDTKAIACDIEFHLRHQRPLSVIRIGDGEGALLMHPDWEGILRNVCLHRWFGRPWLDEIEIQRLQTLLKRAMSEADIVGYPTQRVEHEDELWTATRDYCLAHLEQNQTHASIDLHQELAKLDRYKDLVACANKVVCVTGWPKAYPDADATILLPVERWSEKIPGVHVEGDHIELYPEIRRAVVVESGPGVLVLVGGGPLGKSYCIAAAEAGGVGLDVGSMFDYWGGGATRSYHTALQARKVRRGI